MKRLRAQEKTIESLSERNERLEAAVARLQAIRAVLQKALFGSRSEQQEKPRSQLRRGQQPGAAGHGRTRRSALEERIEEHNPPPDACVCTSCGKPYVANGGRSSTVIEIDVQAHTRRIVRPRWRRGCGCASAPTEVSAPARLFARTPYGTSVWARVLFDVPGIRRRFLPSFGLSNSHDLAVDRCYVRPPSTDFRDAPLAALDPYRTHHPNTWKYISESDGSMTAASCISLRIAGRSGS